MTRPTDSEKKMWSGRLSAKTRQQLEKLCKKLGGLKSASETAVVEHAIDELAKAHKIKADK